MFGFMKVVLKNWTPQTFISPWFQKNFRPSSSQVNGQKLEKGEQWKEDERVAEGKSTYFAFNFDIVDSRLGLDFNSLEPFS